MKYFRSYPWGMQLFMFLMMVVTMIGFVGSMAFALIPKFTPYNLAQLEKLLKVIDIHSPAALINVSILLQGFFNLFIFLIPALLFSYLAHPEPAKYLGFRKPGKWIQLVLVVFIMLGAMPILQMTEEWISHIDFGASVKASQAANDNITSAFLNMPTPATFIRTFIVIAIIPAFGEELFFRGILMRFAKKKSRTMVAPILFTAAVFAYSHTNIYGYLSIFLAGVLLAVIYNLTGSLWCSIAAHLFFNGFQIVVSYLSKNNAVENNGGVPYYLVAIGAVVFGISFYLLLKNKTPLPENWTDDFTEEELSQSADI